MSYIFLDEESFVILLLVESDNSLHIELFEYVYILVRMVTVSLVLVPFLDGAHECHEFSGNDPVEVTIFDSLVLFVLFDIECLEIVPLELDGILESLEALEQRALVKAIALGGISVSFEQRMVWLEYLVSLLSRALQDDDHEAAHQECAINHLFWLLGCAVVENSVVQIIFVPQESCEFPRIPVDHGQVQRSEILVEWHIGQIVVDVEEESVFVVLGRLEVRDPVQFV